MGNLQLLHKDRRRNEETNAACFRRKASDESSCRESSDAVAGDEDSRGSNPEIIEGSKAPAKSSHSISNELDRTERPGDISSSDGNPAGCNPTELTKVLVSELPRPPEDSGGTAAVDPDRRKEKPKASPEGHKRQDAVAWDGNPRGGKPGMIVGSEGARPVASPNIGDILLASELPRPQKSHCGQMTTTLQSSTSPG